MLYYHKTIDKTDASIFYSIIKYNNIIYCFRRKYLDMTKRVIDVLIMDNNLNIKSYSSYKYRGEDPRSFIHNKVLYLVDNYYNDNHLINVNNNKYLKLKIDGKNLTFISHNDKIFVIYRMKPFILYEMSLLNGDFTKIIEDRTECNDEYRGGTPGYYKTENIYYGFGHRTHYIKNKLIHDIFMWELDLNSGPKLKITDIEKPTIAKNICDPVSIIEIDNIKYLITAESDLPWFEKQEYITNCYKIVF